jgi:hypothetical protein
MGNEAKCTARVGRKAVEGKAVLETKELIFRSPELRVAIKLAEIETLAVTGEALQVTWPGGTASFELGAAAAAKWKKRIENPPSLLDKLGVKPGMRVSVRGVNDEAFLSDLRTRVEKVDVKKDCDLIFFAASKRADLSKLPALRDALVKNGALWVIRPKGVPEISEKDVMSEAKAAGLVDVKVASFSATHTAEKLVIPVSAR